MCLTSGSEGITFRVVGEGCSAQVQHCFWFVRAQGLVDAILFWDIDPQYEPTAALNGDTWFYYCVE